MAYLQINRFMGLNTQVDARNLRPSSDTDGVAEATVCNNIDLTDEGALKTAHGYVKVSEIADTGGVKSLVSYDRDLDNRYLIIAHKNKYYSITEDDTTWSDTYLGDYGNDSDYVDGITYSGKPGQATATIVITNFANLTLGGDDVITINGVDFKATTSAVTPGQSLFRAATSNDATATSLRAQINAHLSFKIKDITATGSSATVTVTDDFGGLGGNDYTLAYTPTGTVGLTISGAKFVGGVESRKVVMVATDAASFSASLTSAMDYNALSSGALILAVFMGRLFYGKGKTLFYTDVEDDMVAGGTIGFNDLITGLKVEGQRLIVFTRSYHQGVFFTYNDAFALSTPLKEAYERPYGCLAPKSIQSIGAESYYWSERGILKLGAESGYDSDGIPRPMALSTEIRPTLGLINKKQRYKSDSAYIAQDQQYWLAVPFGKSPYPDGVLVFNETWKTWSTRSGFSVGAMELFRNSDYEEELYFGDATNPIIYKFDKEKFSYDGEAYSRTWKSKIFTMGSGRTFKIFKRLDLAGAMDENTNITVTLSVDGVDKKYEINSDNILRSARGEYLGDNYWGDMLYGGDESEETRFKRFYAPLDFDKEIREGVELQITIENDGEEEPWKIDFIGIDYEMTNILQVPRRRFVNTSLTT